MNVNPTVKRILCYGDSLTFGKIPGPTRRYSSNERWTGLLQGLLGEQYEIIEEGLRGRTTDLNDPNSIGRNGLEYFQSCILSHLPVNLVIILLGTNDLKEKFHRNAAEIASVFKKYKEAISFATKYLEEKEPKILLIAPPPISEVHAPAEWGYKGGENKSKAFSQEYSKIAKVIEADFLNLDTIVQPSSIDGIHLDKENNKKLATVLSEKITQMLEA